MDGTESCQKAHFGIVLSGKMAIRMDDDHEIVMNQNDPKGHNSWCVGDEPGVFLEFNMD